MTEYTFRITLFENYSDQSSESSSKYSTHFKSNELDWNMDTLESNSTFDFIQNMWTFLFSKKETGASRR